MHASKFFAPTFSTQKFCCSIVIGLCPHSLFLSFSLSQAHTHALSLNFFRRSILTLHIFNSQALSRITRTSEWARENEKEKNGRVRKRERKRERVRESVCALWSNCGKSIYCWIACNGIKRGFILAAQIELQTQKKGFHLIFLSLNGPVEIFSSSKKCGDQFSE